MSEHACSHLVDAMNKKGWDYQKVATELGLSEEHIKDVFTGKSKPTPVEFNAILKVLGVNENPPHDASHATTAKS
ncbi:DNA-binding helix turn-helix protein [Rhizoctonia solani AG-3 Rhs1AP]|uniref:DNA-binding helix turn-helix protein n=1 Tax=Rhizoctonia solani AG-3 Rhs1AP TaxID=1086054 RepID=X8J621_9AGAM|nr:DNA-binding helix turn-helix protein [Rhizoctonia solani AG-3 Rhs1AP]